MHTTSSPQYAVFFDLDGTLLDTAPSLSQALNKLLESKNKPSLPYEKIREVVSDGAYAMIKLAFNVDREDPQTPGLRQELLDNYYADLSSKTTVFPGIEQLIQELASRDICWGVVTNKPQRYAEPLMASFSFAIPPVCVLSPEHVQHPKPSAEPLILACKKAKCTYENAIYVGDHIRDIESGKNANMKTIAVNYGYISADENITNWGADYIAETGYDIWPIIEPLITNS